MNKIILKGIIRNIQYSHTINNIQYQKADVGVQRDDREDIIPLRFKSFSNRYAENQLIELVGNIRSYSQKLDNGKNKILLYVFTYFDIPEVSEDDKELINYLDVDGRICKIEELKITSSKKQVIHFILANNIITQNGQKINTYIPMVAWGKLAIKLSNLHVNNKIRVIGQMHSRLYNKQLDDGEIEIRTAHEGVALDVEVIE